MALQTDDDVGASSMASRRNVRATPAVADAAEVPSDAASATAVAIAVAVMVASAALAAAVVAANEAASLDEAYAVGEATTTSAC